MYCDFSYVCPPDTFCVLYFDSAVVFGTRAPLIPFEFCMLTIPPKATTEKIGRRRALIIKTQTNPEERSLGKYLWYVSPYETGKK